MTSIDVISVQWVKGTCTCAVCMFCCLIVMARFFYFPAGILLRLHPRRTGAPSHPRQRNEKTSMLYKIVRHSQHITIGITAVTTGIQIRHLVSHMGHCSIVHMCHCCMKTHGMRDYDSSLHGPQL